MTENASALFVCELVSYDVAEIAIKAKLGTPIIEFHGFRLQKGYQSVKRRVPSGVFLTSVSFATLKSSAQRDERIFYFCI